RCSTPRSPAPGEPPPGCGPRGPPGPPGTTLPLRGQGGPSGTRAPSPREEPRPRRGSARRPGPARSPHGRGAPLRWTPAAPRRSEAGAATGAPPPGPGIGDRRCGRRSLRGCRAPARRTPLPAWGVPRSFGGGGRGVAAIVEDFQPGLHSPALGGDGEQGAHRIDGPAVAADHLAHVLGCDLQLVEGAALRGLAPPPDLVGVGPQ